MSTITIVGAGMMGTALCWPLVDNGHIVRLVGTPLDAHIISRIRQDSLHPNLDRSIPDGVEVFSQYELQAALSGAQVIASGVSSFGVDWFTEAVGSYLHPDIPVIAVTKGLAIGPGGSLQILPHYIQQQLGMKGLSLNAIAGPCIAHELAARRQTAVVFCGPDQNVLKMVKGIFQTSYYHIWTSTDEVGVEICAALKNAYALAVGMAVGMMEQAGPDGLANMYNPQAAVFAQSVHEMVRFLELFGGGVENVHWLPGPGDLYVTVFGGRTVRMGKLLGAGIPYLEARQRMAGETLESIEIITRVGHVLPQLEESGMIKSSDFPLMRHLFQVIHQSHAPGFPWDRFFHANLV